MAGFKVLMIALPVYLLAAWILPPLFRRRSGETVPLRRSNGTRERVRCIDDNADALLWRMRVIEAAENEIAFTTFDFREDESGMDMMACLLAAAERGVKVKLLLDGFYAAAHLGTARHFHALAARDNIEVKLYNHLSPARAWTLNYRMHDKILIADGDVYILGGRNTNDLFLGAHDWQRNIDRDVLVWRERGGGSVRDVRAYFDVLWALDCSRPRHWPSGKQETAEALDDLRRRYASLRAAYPDAFAGTDWRAATLETKSVRFLANPPDAANKAPLLWNTLCALMDGAEDVIVETPYIILDRRMYADIARLTAGGTRLRFLTNAAESGANVLGCSDYLNQKEHILETGTEVYEHHGERSLHTKTLAIGGELCAVGSFNFDMRSARIDTETMLLIDCGELNAHIRETARRRMEESVHVLPDGTENAGTGCAPGTAGRFRPAAYTLMRVLTLPLRHLL